jgi:hypothetical protein
MVTKSRAKTVAIYASAVLGFTLLCGSAVWYCDYHGVHFSAGRQQDLFWADWAFVSLERVERENNPDLFRLTLFAPLKGSQLARRELDIQSDRPVCQPVRPKLLWCRWGEELHLLSAASLGTVEPWKALRRLHPSLETGLSSLPARVDPASGRIMLGTNDGQRVVIDPIQRRADLSSLPEGLPGLGSRPAATAASQEIDGITHHFEGSASTDRQVLVRRDPETHRPVRLQFSAEAGPDGASASTYLKAEFITPEDTRSGQPGLLAEPPGFLVAHQTSLDRARARRLVTRVDAQGRPLWTAELPLGDIRAAFVGADRLVLAQRGDCEQTHALALADGRLLWTYEH